MTKIDYTQLTENFKKKWNLVAGANKRLREDIQHLLDQVVETEDEAERGKLKTDIETQLDRIHTNRNALLAFQSKYSFLCGKYFSKMWLPEEGVDISFDPDTQDFRIE